MNSRGVTLVELIIAMAVISVAVAGMMSAYSNMMRRSADPLVYQQSLAIAEAIMEEVAAKPYLAPNGSVCPAHSGGRSTYDNVCDYDGFSLSPITDLSGNDLQLDGYSVDVSVEPVSATELNAIGIANALRIKVTVFTPLVSTDSDPKGLEVVLTSYRARY